MIKKPKTKNQFVDICFNLSHNIKFLQLNTFIIKTKW